MIRTKYRSALSKIKCLKYNTKLQSVSKCLRYELRFRQAGRGESGGSPAAYRQAFLAISGVEARMHVTITDIGLRSPSTVVP